MGIDAIPNFTGPASKLRAAIPEPARKLLLSNVWCSKCGRDITITNFTGVVKSQDLLLVGKCSECRSDVARLIES